MSYDAILTDAEFRTFLPNGEVVRYLELTRQRLGLEKHEMNVLDWGSGRGEYVAWLRDAGYNAFGAEIRQEASERGKELIAARGHDYDRVIRPIMPNCKTDLPEGFFHFVFTHYVLEHVADIDAVTQEIARIMAPGGCGFHVYPGQLRLIEPHLFMPFVHWLPKRLVRKRLIRACLALGIDPRWDWLEGASAEKKAQAYYEFCVHETFYRPFHQVRASFNQVGLEVTPVVGDHPALQRLRALPAPLRRPLVDVPVMMFQTVEILVRKPGAAYAVA
jgi:SAM-dependent methyltransferase